MRNFETSQKEESRAQSADSSKAYRKPSRAFNCSLFACFLLFQAGKNRMQLNYRVNRCGDKNQNRRQKVLNRGLKFSQGDLRFWKFDKIFTDLQCFIFKFRRAELTNAYRGDWTGLNFPPAYNQVQSRATYIFFLCLSKGLDQGLKDSGRMWPARAFCAGRNAFWEFSND